MKKPHKHAELIKAWADGAEIEFKSKVDDEWKVMETLLLLNEFEYRIKPESKPDVVEYWIHKTFAVYEADDIEDANLRLTFDGETGELKSAEVLK